MPHYLSLRVVIMRFKVRNKWGTGACSGASPSIYFTLGEAFSFIGTRGRHLMSHQRQMWNQSKVWIQNQMVQVPRGWNVWHRASEGQQQRNHYANSRPLCLTSNNTALYICKAWQDTVHTGLLSKWSHARLVDDPCLRWDYWARLHTSSRQTLTNTGTSYRMCSARHISGVKRGRTLGSPSVPQTLGNESEVE